MYLARELTKASLSEIGEAFGGRDHGTVLHAHRLVKRRMREGGESAAGRVVPRQPAAALSVSPVSKLSAVRQCAPRSALSAATRYAVARENDCAALHSFI